jgi:hypothetical protein
VVRLDNLSVLSETILDDSEFESLFSVFNTRFHETLDVDKVGFDKGIYISDTEFSLNARFRSILVEDDLELDDILVPGLLELFNGSIRGKTKLEQSTVNIADFRGTTFSGPLDFIDNSHAGVTLLSGASLGKGARFDHNTMAGGIDLRHAEIGSTNAPLEAHDSVAPGYRDEEQDVSVQLENSFVGGAIILQGSNWMSAGGRSASLQVNASTFEKIELNDWQTFRRISQPPSGSFASRDLDDRLWNDYFAYLRATEAGYRRDGYADLAEAADLYRMKLEARRGGLWKQAEYMFLDVSCRHGYELERIPVAWIAVIVLFAGAFMHYSKKYRKHPRSIHKSQFMHRLRDFSEDLSCSFLSFFNLERALGKCYPMNQREHAYRLMHIERLVGVIILFISAALAGAFLSK